MNEAFEKYAKSFMEKHMELSRLLDMPPINQNEKAREEFKAYETSWAEFANTMYDAAPDADTSFMDKEPFADWSEKYASDIEEAELYYKRYGNSASGIAKANEEYGK